MEDALERLARVWTPHPGQLAFLNSTAQTRVLACGRRWGKTDAAAASLVLEALAHPHRRMLVVAPTQRQTSFLFERAVQMLGSVGVRADLAKKVRRSPHPIVDADGLVLQARSGHQADFLRGDEADHIVVDEAAFVAESTVVDVLLPMLATTRGRLTLISTPNGRNWFWRLFERGQGDDPKFWSRRGPSSENPRVSPEFLEVQRSLASDAAYRTEIEAEFVDGEDQVFRTEVVEAALVREVQVPAHAPVVIGLDIGFLNDATALIALQGDRRGARLLGGMHFTGLLAPFLVQRVRDFVHEFPGATLVIDGTGSGMSVSHDLAVLEGFARPILPVQFSEPNKRSMIGNLAWGLERGSLKLLPLVGLTEELLAFRGETTRTGRTRLSAPSGLHDDWVIALALAWHGLGERLVLRPDMFGLGPSTSERFELR